MLKNYFKVAFRNLNKNRVYAFINILGLGLGLAITILVFMFVKFVEYLTLSIPLNF